MITFKQFLSEALEVQDAREFFRKEAGPFVQQAKGHGVFLRGADNKPPTIARVELPSGRVVDVGMMSVRKDRIPMNMPKDFHLAADEWMKGKFGIAGRTGAAFVLGEDGRRTAESYGEYLYAVIPRGDFKFIWSPEVEDLFDQYHNGGMRDAVKGLTGEEFNAAVTAELEKINYTDEDLPGALDSENEVMIECEYLLVVDVTDSEGDADGYGAMDSRTAIRELKEALK
ncbi:hypothetical protein [Janthinobacterium sp.]|uniref:hypothetical protein n=1 Tax=Janthinobacterium sp. TaxID=1871054 RepID=UPI0026116785|nr:hypothetical protein [Janthinobacterium sp.]